jgi:putative spermidine/putrescine transport system substrate-binding protein/spermidine/putrescine transport system substrate-binding protein
MAVSAEGQGGVFRVNGYSSTNPVAAAEFMTPEEFSALHQDDPDYLNSLLLWQNLADRLPTYTNAWNAVKAQ